MDETSDAGAVLARHTTANGSYYAPWLHMWRSGGTSRFPLFDAVGTARRLVDSSATVTDSYMLDSFGTPTAAATTTINPYRYVGAAGYITDTPGSGLLQLGARFYWPELGRFIQQDPIGDGTNWYAYAGNNPVVYVDPEGLWSAGAEAYLGIGGGFYFGYDPCTGWFVKARAGVGVGVGGGFGDFDPTGGSPGTDAGFSQGGGSFFGFDVGASAGVGPANAGAGTAGGWASDARGNTKRHPTEPQFPIGPLPGYAGITGTGAWKGARIGATAVIEGGFWGL